MGVVSVMPDRSDDDQDTTSALPIIDESVTLAGAIAALIAILTSLRDALDRQTVAGLVEPLMTRRDLARALQVSLPQLDRLRAAGRLPKPDLTLSRSPRWRASSVRRWLEGGAK
jgi:predicted DNA-binding transcriptional regulator AlpA